MPTPTYTPLATVTLGTATASITFSSIPATYRDLILVINGTMASAGNFSYRLNGDSGNNYNIVYAQAWNGGVLSGTLSPENRMLPWVPNNIDTSGNFYWQSQLMDYAATDKQKTALNRINGLNSGSQLTAMSAGRWANTAAVTSMNVIATQNFSVGSTFSLYGVIA